jgi:hypothetical protein
MIRVVNLEADFPTLDEARRVLIQEVGRALTERVPVLKLIHGYGSTGLGGVLRHGIRKSLLLRKKEGLVLEIVFGEHWDIFDNATLRVLSLVPELRNDQDLERYNPGVTIVLLNLRDKGR